MIILHGHSNKAKLFDIARIVIVKVNLPKVPYIKWEKPLLRSAMKSGIKVNYPSLHDIILYNIYYSCLSNFEIWSTQHDLCVKNLPMWLQRIYLSFPSLFLCYCLHHVFFLMYLPNSSSFFQAIVCKNYNHALYSPHGHIESKWFFSLAFACGPLHWHILCCNSSSCYVGKTRRIASLRIAPLNSIKCKACTIWGWLQAPPMFQATSWVRRLPAFWRRRFAILYLDVNLVDHWIWKCVSCRLGIFMLCNDAPFHKVNLIHSHVWHVHNRT